MVRVFRPTPEEQLFQDALLVPRVASLNGKRIGLLWNSKPNADVFLGRFKDLVREQYGETEFVWHAKRMAAEPVEPESLRELVTCDAVVSAFGD